MLFGKPDDRSRYLTHIALASAGAILLLIVLSLLGPSPEQVDRWFLHTGAEGPQTLLDDVHIIPDQDKIRQQEEQTMAGATRGMDVQVEKQTHSPQPLKRPLPQIKGAPQQLALSQEMIYEGQRFRNDPRDLVQMNRTAQQSLDFVLLEWSMPGHPQEAPSYLRNRLVLVVVAMYVNEDGHVEHAYIVSSDGGSLYDQAVLEAVKQWIYKPLIFNGKAQGFWDEIHFRFPPIRVSE